MVIRPAAIVGLLGTLAVLIPPAASAPAKGFHGQGRHHRNARHHLYFRPQHGICPDTTLEPSRHDVEVIRAATLCLINRERAVHGERPLRWNNRLLGAAQAHTESMAFGDYFAHTGPRGQTPLGRIRHAGYVSSSRFGYEVGENIAWATRWLATPKAIVAAWMASPGHRANILDPRYRETGIGVSPHPPASYSHGARGGIYTQDFGVIIRG